MKTIMRPALPLLPVLVLAAACSDPGTSVPSRATNPTPAQRTRDSTVRLGGAWAD